MWLETETGDVEPRTVNGGETLKHRGEQEEPRDGELCNKRQGGYWAGRQESDQR